MCRILVTSGGTSEKIDDVRSITNKSTGSLGSLIADAFLQTGATVDCITTRSAHHPENPQVGVHYIESAADLVRTLEALMTAHRYHCVVHAMAVSDYTVDAVTSLQEIEAAVRGGQPVTDGGRTAHCKISSDLDNVVLVLRPTPKVIHLIKELQPDTMLFGFKLLVGAAPEELEAAAMKVLRGNSCDYVVANDLRNISGDQHIATIFSATGTMGVYANKEEIAAGVVAAAASHWKE